MSNECYNDLLITNLLPEQKQEILDCFFKEDDESEWESKFLQTFCPDSSRWGRGSELYAVQIDNESQKSEFSCSFYTSWDSPLEGLYETAQKIPNALIKIRYYEPGEDFCGVALFKDKKVYEYTHQLSDVKEMWLKEYRPDMYLRLQAQGMEEDPELEEELEDTCGDIEFDIVNWMLDPIAECLHKVLSNPSEYGASIDVNLCSNVITVPLDE
jgi:hypothetical protein